MKAARVPCIIACMLTAGGASAGSLSIYVTPGGEGNLPVYTNTSLGAGSVLHMSVSRQASGSAWRTVAVSPASPLPSGSIDRTLRELVADRSQAYGVPAALVLAVMQVESNFDPAARSSAGAVGLMQIMPMTGLRYGVSQKLDHPRTNIDVGARYLKDLLRMFDGDTELALAAYNAGEGAVIKHGRRIPPYAETRAYVPRVMRLYERYNKHNPL